MTPEHKLMYEIALYCGKHNWLYLRQDSGTFYTQNGTPVKIGFPGLSDILIITDTGKPIFVETKIKPRKPTQEQVSFIENMKSRGVKAFVCYSIENFVNEIMDI